MSTRSTLHDLISICEDGHKGFLTAAENIKDADIQKLFADFSAQRAQFVEQLQPAARDVPESEESEGTVQGAVHRGWIALEGAVLDDPHAVLAECERGESWAVSEYEKALKAELPPQVREIVSAQYAAVLTAQETIRKLADAAAPEWE